MIKPFLLRAAVVGIGLGAAGVASAQTCPETLDPQANYKCVFINTGAGNTKPFGDGVTGAFYELGLSGTRATSIYQAGLALGSAVIDTNRTSILQSYGLNTGTYNNVTNVGPQVAIQDTPAFPGEKNIDSLNNTNDNEGLNANFGVGLQGWNLTFDYLFNGTLTAGGPVFSSGDINFFHTDIATGISTQVLKVNITGSNLDPANLALFGKITFDFDGDNNILDDCTTALCQDFWNFQTGPANWFDLEGSGVEISFALDTNVNPPFPTLQSLTAGSDPNEGIWARQTTLDSSIRFNQIPEPGSLALVGVALLGLAGAAKRRARRV